MPNQYPLVSLITVNYNQIGVTCELFDSLRAIDYPNLEIILVDNGSKVDETPVIATKYPEVKIIISEENLGFAGGNNLAVEEAKGEYLFFINNDTEIPNGTIPKLLAAFDKIPNLGMISPKLLYWPKQKGVNEIIQYVGATPVSNVTARNKILGEMEPDNNQYTELKETAYAHGAAMMVPRKVINEVGMMFEDFFLYYEELDWCEQIKRAGYKIYIEPNVHVYHKESISVGKMSTLKTYYLNRNRIYFMKRNRSTISLFFFTLFLIFVTVPKNVLMFILKGDWDHAKVFLKAVWWNVGSPKITKKSKLVTA